MQVHRRLAAFILRDVAKDRDHLALFIDADRLVGFGLPVQPRDDAALQSADGADLGTVDLVVSGKSLEAGDGFLPVSKTITKVRAPWALVSISFDFIVAFPRMWLQPPGMGLVPDGECFS